MSVDTTYANLRCVAVRLIGFLCGVRHFNETHSLTMDLQKKDEPPGGIKVFE